MQLQKKEFDPSGTSTGLHEPAVHYSEKVCNRKIMHRNLEIYARLIELKRCFIET